MTLNVFLTEELRKLRETSPNTCHAVSMLMDEAVLDADATTATYLYGGFVGHW